MIMSKSLEEDFADWVVLVEKVDGILREPSHVFGDCEAEVIEQVFLLENNAVAKSSRQVCDVGWVGKSVERSGEECDWDLDVLQRHERRIVGAVALLVIQPAVVVQAALARVDHLRVINEGAVALA